MIKNCTPLSRRRNCLRTVPATHTIAGIPKYPRLARLASTNSMRPVSLISYSASPEANRDSLPPPNEEKRPRNCLLLARNNPGGHQTDVIHARGAPNINDLRHIAEINLVIALDEHDALGAIGVDIGQPLQQL